jgi:flagellar biosynthesis protein FliR
MSVSPSDPIDFGSAATFGGLVAARLLPLVAFTPLFGGEAASKRLRTGLALLLLAPLVAHADTRAVATADASTLALLTAKEIMVGAMIALSAMIVFETLAAAGALFDLARGQSMASVLDPQSQQTFSPLSVFMRQASLVLFLTVGGYHLVLDAVVESFLVLPVTSFPAVTSMRELFADLAFRALPQLFVVAFKLALAPFAVALLVDLVFGLLGRAAPAMQTYVLSLPLRALLGFLAVLLSMQVALDVGQQSLETTIVAVRDAFGM